MKHPLDNTVAPLLTPEQVLADIKRIFDSMQRALRGNVALVDNPLDPNCRIYTDAEIGQ